MAALLKNPDSDSTAVYWSVSSHEDAASSFALKLARITANSDENRPIYGLGVDSLVARIDSFLALEGDGNCDAVDIFDIIGSSSLVILSDHEV